VLQDADAHVRMAAVLTLSELPASPRAAASIAEMIMVPQNARDPWLPDAAAIAGVRQGTAVALSLLRWQAPGRLAQDSAYLTGLARTVRMTAHHFAMNENVEATLAFLQALPAANTTIAAGVLEGIAGGPADARGQQRGGPGGWPQGSQPELTAQQRAVLVEVARKVPAELADGFARVTARWGVSDLFAAR
jgi:hypothetical protein